MECILLVHSSINGHLGHLHILATVSSTAVGTVCCQLLEGFGVSLGTPVGSQDPERAVLPVTCAAQRPTLGCPPTSLPPWVSVSGTGGGQFIPMHCFRKQHFK